MAALASASVSLVRVSFSLATAPMSPAFSSGTVAGVLPCITIRLPRRSSVSRVRLRTVESEVSTP